MVIVAGSGTLAWALNWVFGAQLATTISKSPAAPGPPVNVNTTGELPPPDTLQEAKIAPIPTPQLKGPTVRGAMVMVREKKFTPLKFRKTLAPGASVDVLPVAEMKEKVVEKRFVLPEPLSTMMEGSTTEFAWAMPAKARSNTAHSGRTRRIFINHPANRSGQYSASYGPGGKH